MSSKEDRAGNVVVLGRVGDEGQPTERIEAAQKAVPLRKPRMSGAALIVQQAVRLIKEGKAAVARSLLEEAIGQRTDRPKLSATLGAACLALGDQPGALAAYAIAHAGLPEDGAIAVAYAKAARALGLIAEAQRAYEAVAPADIKNRLSAELGLARCAAALKDDAGETHHLRIALAMRPEHRSAARDLVRALKRIGLLREAADVARGYLAAATEPDAGMLRELAGVLGRSGDFEEQVAALEETLRIEPERAETWCALATVTARLAGREAQLGVLDRAEQAMGRHARFHLARAAVLSARGQLAAADVERGYAIALAPVDRSIISPVVGHLLKDGRVTEAEALMAPLVDDPKAVGLFLKVEAKRAEREGDSAGVRAAYTRLAELDRSASVLVEQARLALLDLDLPAAVDHLEEARAVARARGSGAPGRLLAELVNEARIHGPALSPAREARLRGDVAGLLDAFADEPGSTAIASGLLQFLSRQGRLARRPVSPIPRHIHQFWDTEAVPADVAEVMASWRRHHPDHAYTRYDEVSAEAYLRRLDRPDLLKAWRRARMPAHKGDLFRLALLHAEGGIYADADDCCLAPIEGLIGQASLVLRHEQFGSAGNNFIAVVAGHPVIGAALEEAVAASNEGGAETIWLRTGPGAITRALVAYLAADPARLDTLGQHILLLNAAEFSRYIYVHCRLDYKSGDKAWQKSDLSQTQSS